MMMPYHCLEFPQRVCFWSKADIRKGNLNCVAAATATVVPRFSALDRRGRAPIEALAKPLQHQETRWDATQSGRTFPYLNRTDFQSTKFKCQTGRHSLLAGLQLEFLTIEIEFQTYTRQCSQRNHVTEALAAPPWDRTVQCILR